MGHVQRSGDACCQNELESLNIQVELVAVPANMTHFFLPLDLTVNGSAKKFMRKQFIT